MQQSHQELFELYQTAVRVSQPQHCMASWLNALPNTLPKEQPICVLGAGKAAAEMAAEAYAYFGDACYGAVVTRYGYETQRPTGKIDVLLAAHPVPDENSLIGGQKLLQMAADVPPDVPVLFLISGGGSALACVPAEGISLQEKTEVHRFLLSSGAAIEEMNTVRKHLSAIKGGKLAAATGKRTTSLVISDVVGDDPAFIASGMTIFDNTTPADALAILRAYHWPHIDNPASNVFNYLLNASVIEPLVSDYHSDYQIVANAQQAIDAAVAQSQQDGWETLVLSYDETGEASKVAQQHAQRALAIQSEKKPADSASKGIRLFSGGELTVTLNRGEERNGQAQNGDGGPNQEYLLALALALNGADNIVALSADTDGVDGSKDVAGGFIDSGTLQRAQAQGLDAKAILAQHNSFAFFHALDNHIIVDPTCTNVNDFRVIEIRY